MECCKGIAISCLKVGCKWTPIKPDLGAPIEQKRKSFSLESSPKKFDVGQFFNYWPK